MATNLKLKGPCPGFPALLVATSVAIVGCAHRFDAAATPAIVSNNATANDAFRKAREAFDRGALDAADQAFRRFVQQHPKDTLTPLAQVFLGRIAIRRGQLTSARDHLTPVAKADNTHAPAENADRDPVRALARYHLGLAQVRRGDHVAGRRLLQPFLEQASASTLPALLAALGRACFALRDYRAAASHLTRLHAVSDRPTEKLWARETLSEMIDKHLSAASLRALYGSAGNDSLLKALTAKRLIAVELAAGRTAEANKIREQSAATLTQHQQNQRPAAGAPPGPIGVLLPFSGRYRSAGHLALGGCVFAAGSFQKDGKPATLLIRDSGEDPLRQARELIDKHGVIALVGGLDSSKAAAVASLATNEAVPFLTLNSRAAPSPTSTTLRLLPTNEQRARLLARRAATRPGARLAILAPDSAYGQMMSKAFAAEAQRRGAVLVVRLSYPNAATSFTSQAKRLARSQFDGLFIPDSARRLALISPALALAGLWSTPPDGKPTKGRAIRIFATADGATAALVGNAGRYLDGALIAPGFFPDDAAPGSGPMVRAFQQARGKLPDLVSAFAADAVSALRDQIHRGARSRAALLAALRKRSVVGFTGQVQFSSSGYRAHPPLLYRVSRTAIRRVRD